MIVYKYPRYLPIRTYQDVTTETIIPTYSKMDPEIKVKWLEALRSDRFRQGSGFLKDCDGDNCCLGVLAEINDIPWEASIDSFSEGSFAFTFPRGDEEEEGTDDNGNADTYIDIHQIPNGYCGIDAVARDELINRNDGARDFERHSFAQLADWIEKNL